jgi:hypothetical protein
LTDTTELTTQMRGDGTHDRLSAEDLTFCRDFVERRRWQAARSARNPHSYTIRGGAHRRGLWDTDDATAADFDRFVDLIYRCGYVGDWGGQTWPYLDVDELTYFTYGYPTGDDAPDRLTTTVLNCKPVAAVDADRNSEPWGDRPGNRY